MYFSMGLIVCEFQPLVIKLQEGYYMYVWENGHNFFFALSEEGDNNIFKLLDFRLGYGVFSPNFCQEP